MRVTSSASSRVRGGRIPPSRRASIVLPVPGGPTSSALWPPAAAIVSARMGAACPRTSRRSSMSACRASRDGAGGKLGRRVAAQDRRDAREVAHARDGDPVDQPGLRRALARHDEPVEPVSPSALRHGERARRTGAARRRGTARRRPPSGRRAPPAPGRWRRAGRTPSRGRSPGPDFGRYAGARLTVTRRFGNSKPELRTAECTRSRDSRTAASPRPTMVNPGRPVRRSTSTVIRREARPSMAKVVRRASMCPSWSAARCTGHAFCDESATAP